MRYTQKKIRNFQELNANRIGKEYLTLDGSETQNTVLIQSDEELIQWAEYFTWGVKIVSIDVMTGETSNVEMYANAAKLIGMTSPRWK